MSDKMYQILQYNFKRKAPTGGVVTLNGASHVWKSFAPLIVYAAYETPLDGDNECLIDQESGIQVTEGRLGQLRYLRSLISSGFIFESSAAL